MNRHTFALLISLLVLMGLSASCHAKTQFDFTYPGQHSNYFRSGLGPDSSLVDVDFHQQQGRVFFTTLTVTLATSTYVSVFTKSTTCTTSTSNLKVCSPSKGRRRRSQRDIGSLMYHQDEDTEEIDSNVFLVPDPK